MRILLTIAFIASYLLTFDVVIAQPAPVEADLAPRGVEINLREYAHQVAIEHGLNASKFAQVITCESNWNPNIQSFHTYNFSKPEVGIYFGEREQSYGIVQIHVPVHDVTIEQAKDPIFSIDWMADRWVEGYQHWWSCYKK